MLHTIPGVAGPSGDLRLRVLPKLRNLRSTSGTWFRSRRKANGQSRSKSIFTDEGLIESSVITRGEGVRNLEREIGSCFRKLARRFVSEAAAEGFKDTIDAARVREILGPIKFRQKVVARRVKLGWQPGWLDRNWRRSSAVSNPYKGPVGDADRQTRRCHAGIGAGRCGHV